MPTNTPKAAALPAANAAANAADADAAVAVAPVEQEPDTPKPADPAVAVPEPADYLDPCPPPPEFTRLRYFYGRSLSHHDLSREQQYFREKLKLHNRCLHGYGVRCGLDVRPDVGRQCVPPETPKAGAPPTPVPVWVDCGIGLDCEGNELIVRRPIKIDLADKLRQAGIVVKRETPATLYVSICYCEQNVNPLRPSSPNACGDEFNSTFGAIREGVRITVDTRPPRRPDPCAPCCFSCDPTTDKRSGKNSCECGCCNCCLLLARIDNYVDGTPIEKRNIHNEVRTWLGPQPFVTITGVNWVHGAKYSIDQSRWILGSGIGAEHDWGIEFHFSDDVQIASLAAPGVVDVWNLLGANLAADQISYPPVRPVGPVDPTEDPPPPGYARSFRYEYAGEEGVNPGDLLRITLRCAFILDRYGRPVDGTNVGGLVPMKMSDGAKAEFERRFGTTAVPPDERGIDGSRRAERCPPFSTGTGSPGGNFESWFYVDTPASKKAGRNQGAQS